MKNPDILLVEDNEDDVSLTQMAFNRAGLKNNLVVAKDGKEAIEYLLGSNTESPHVCPTLILLDLKLPKMDGLEVLKAIRNDSRTCLCPVVILTSSDEQSDIVTSYKLGTNAYIRKPVKFQEFVQAVSQLGLFWLVLNEPPPSGIKG